MTKRYAVTMKETSEGILIESGVPWRSSSFGITQILDNGLPAMPQVVVPAWFLAELGVIAQTLQIGDQFDLSLEMERHTP